VVQPDAALPREPCGVIFTSRILGMLLFGKLVRKSDGPLEIEQIMNTMAKYDGMMMQDRPRVTE
jgi:hypothetical protein